MQMPGNGVFVVFWICGNIYVCFGDIYVLQYECNDGQMVSWSVRRLRLSLMFCVWNGLWILFQTLVPFSCFTLYTNIYIWIGNVERHRLEHMLVGKTISVLYTRDVELLHRLLYFFSPQGAIRWRDGVLCGNDSFQLLLPNVSCCRLIAIRMGLVRFAYRFCTKYICVLAMVGVNRIAYCTSFKQSFWCCCFQLLNTFYLFPLNMVFLVVINFIILKINFLIFSNLCFSKYIKLYQILYSILYFILYQFKIFFFVQ